MLVCLPILCNTVQIAIISWDCEINSECSFSYTLCLLVTAKLSVILLWLSEMLCEVINFGELNLCVMITGKPELPYNMQRVSALLIKFDRANLFLVRHVLL